MQLTQSQKEIAKSNKRFRVINAGRRFGKTFLSCEEIKGFALAKEARIAYIAPTYGQAHDIAWEMLKKELLPIIKKVNESRLELEVYNKDGKSSFVFLRGWESVETLRGQSFDFIIIDEVASMRNFWVGWNEVLSPTLIDRKGSAMFISTPKGFNHFYDLFNLQTKNEDYQSFHFTTYDNPFIPAEEIEREKQTKPEDAFAQEYLADFRKMEGLVYKDFNRKDHLFEDVDHMRATRRVVDTIVGIDFGFTNPTAILTVEIDQDKRYWVTDEYYRTGKTNAEIIEYIRTMGHVIFYPDPAEPDRIEEMKRAGLQVRDVNKDVLKGIDTVKTLLRTQRLKIHTSCVNLISEFETYTYKDKTANNQTPEEPVKEHDHALDALRYALHMKEPEPQRDTNLQNRVLRNRMDNSRTFK